ncbi:MAG: hypothetical protein IT162_19630 [Bryobacterales bacterium]|nr:hypothetical protein [Bryobacterales bacterium]
MTISSVSSAALEGMQAASARVESAAFRVSQAAGGGDVVDLSAEMVALMQAKSMHGAMVNVARMAEETDKQVLNLLA